MRRWRTLKNKKSLRASRGALDAREQQERTDFAAVRARAGGQCEVVLDDERCNRPGIETHHVVKRSQGGRFCSADGLIRVCRLCHDLTDAATTQATTLPRRWGAPRRVVHGRLRIIALGGGRFRCWMETESVKHRNVYRRNTTGASREEIPATGGGTAAPKAPERSEAS